MCIAIIGELRWKNEIEFSNDKTGHANAVDSAGRPRWPHEHRPNETVFKQSDDRHILSEKHSEILLRITRSTVGRYESGSAMRRSTYLSTRTFRLVTARRHTQFD